MQQQLDELAESLSLESRRLVSDRRSELAVQSGKLESLSPLAVLGPAIPSYSLEERADRSGLSRRVQGEGRRGLGAAPTSRRLDAEVRKRYPLATRPAHREGSLMADAKERESKEKEPKKFEEALGELEQVVRNWSPATPPWRSLELFERCVSLAGFCHKKLEEAQKRIEVATKGPRRQNWS